MKRTFWLFAAMGLAVALATPRAEGAIVANINANGNIVTDFSEANELDFDVLLNNFNGVSFDTVIQQGDGPLLALSALFDNFTGQPLGQLRITLTGGVTFAEANLIDAGGGGIGSIAGLGTSTLQLAFNPGVPTGRSLTLGLPSDDLFFPPAVDPGEDFFISLNGLEAGQSFGVNIAVAPVGAPLAEIPEPTSLVVWGIGLGLMTFGAARRKWRSSKAAVSA